jgi:photosystem II protein PsbQ
MYTLQNIKFMVKYRFLVSAFLVAIALLFIFISQPVEAAPTFTYTPERLEQIQRYTTDLQGLRERLLEIPPLVQKGRWVDVQSLIHGPLGELRFKINRLVRGLDPKAQKTAASAAKEVFERLILIDEATLTRDTRKALLNYNGILRDFDAFLELVPSKTL